MTRALETPDPLAVALEPPPNETPSERWAREQAEAQARRISDQIDLEIKAEKLAMKKRKAPIKVLLLGQSESGKSTTVKSECSCYKCRALSVSRMFRRKTSSSRTPNPRSRQSRPHGAPWYTSTSSAP